MSLSDFLTPIDLKNITPKNGFYISHLGEKIAHFSEAFPDLDKKDIAIIGVQDDRNAVNNPGCALGPDYVREKLYQLFEGTYKTKIADLGNIRQGATITDTYFAVKTVVNELIKANKDFDLLLLPNRHHGFAAEPYMTRRRWDYFVRYLMGAEPPQGYELKPPEGPR